MVRSYHDFFCVLTDVKSRRKHNIQSSLVHAKIRMKSRVPLVGIFASSMQLRLATSPFDFNRGQHTNSWSDYCSLWVQLYFSGTILFVCWSWENLLHPGLFFHCVFSSWKRKCLSLSTHVLTDFSFVRLWIFTWVLFLIALLPIATSYM